MGFYAFIPTGCSGVAELGLISGTGMLISLIVTLTIIPALQGYLPSSPKYTTTTPAKQKLTKNWVHRAILIATAFTALTSILVIQDTKFDYNLLNMNDPNAESVETFQELLTHADDSPWYLVTLAKDNQEIKQMMKQLKALPEVSKVVTLLDLAPENQEEKNFFIEEMALTMGSVTFPNSLNKINNPSLEESRVKLKTLINAQPFTQQDIPTSLRTHWQGQNDVYRVNDLSYRRY